MKSHGRVVIEDKNLDFGLIRLYILQRAAIEPTTSLGIAEELTLHGLKLSAGSVSQILRSLEQKGYLVSARAPNGPQIHKIYRLTSRGRLISGQARQKIRELLVGLTI